MRAADAGIPSRPREHAGAPIAFALALISALLALVTMRFLGTPLLDEGAYRIGVVLSGVAGLATGIALPVLRRVPRLRRVAWALAPLAGALVGIGVQVVLLARKPEPRTYLLSSGLTTDEPLAWSLAGAPLGALPALVVAGAVLVAFRVAAPTPSHDDRERVMLPFAACATVVGAGAAAFAEASELSLTIGVTALAAAVLLEILVSDALRARWLRRVFAGEDATHEVVPIETFPAALGLPRVVAAAPLGAVIVRLASESGYRGAARSPVAAAALTMEETLLPIRRRRRVVFGALAGTALVLGAALAMR